MVRFEILRLSGCCDPRCCFLFRYDFEEAPAPIQRPRDGDGAMVASTRPNSLQESRPRMRTFWPRFRSWRPARCPSKLQGSGIPVVKLRQDPFAQPSEQVAQRIEFNDLQSLKGPCRNLGISVPSSCSVVDVGAAISMPGGIVLECTWFAFRGIQKFWHSCYHPRVSKQERRQVSIISDDGFFLRSQVARMSRICVTTPHQIVGFVCDLDSACLQISVLEFV